MSSYGKDDGRVPRDYNITILGKLFSLVGTKTWPQVLKSYGLNAQRGDAKSLTNQQRIELLKKFIDDDKVAMLRIGNGYSKNGNYSSFVSSFMGHWITLWGYNDEEKVFYVYDSYVPFRKYDKSIPIGNIKRTFEEILRDQGKGFPLKWKYNFIQVFV